MESSLEYCFTWDGSWHLTVRSCSQEVDQRVDLGLKTSHRALREDELEKTSPVLVVFCLQKADKKANWATQAKAQR